MSNSYYPRVSVTRAPGYEDFTGDLLLEFKSGPYYRSVVRDSDNHLAVIRSEHVSNVPDGTDGYAKGE